MLVNSALVMLSAAILVLASAALIDGHTVISYPGWRGNNLITNDSFPYGMQWIYPCGGTPPTTNRTFWPTTGGAIAFQPGWFQGHATAFLYINLGFGTDGPGGGPPNMSNPMWPVFQLQGPSRNPYPGTICMPQVPPPKDAVVKAGDNATIQIVLLAVHGAALYSCVDITFAEPGDPRIPEVNDTNCFNSNDIGFADVFTIVTNEAVNRRTSDGEPSVRFWYFNRSRGNLLLTMLTWLPAVVGGLWLFL